MNQNSAIMKSSLLCLQVMLLPRQPVSIYNLLEKETVIVIFIVLLVELQIVNVVICDSTQVNLLIVLNFT